jgi:dipeptidase
MIFGKNTDREPNEAHFIEVIPAADHPPGSSVQCTYIEIPQVEHTYRVLLAKPFWIWGAEMGVNEHGVAIGNEAIFSKVKPSRDGVLLGMDFLRLALERSKTGQEAVAVIIELLKEHGQGGNGEFERVLYYHNSYIIADPNEAWVLESVDRHWATKRITDVYSISNGLTIGSTWDARSPELVEFAIQRGWCREEKDFSFSKCYSDFLYTTFSSSTTRRKRTLDILEDNLGEISVPTMISVLRDHGKEDGSGYRPDKGITQQTVCAHANFGPIRVAQTTGSLVAYLDPENPVLFVTGTAAPCTSTFKPIWLDSPLPDMGPIPSGKFDSQSLFWKHERLHRTTFMDYSDRLEVFKEERDRLETELINGAISVRDQPMEKRADFSAQCFSRSEKAAEKWLDKVERIPINNPQSWYHRLAWNNVNKRAGILIQVP